MSRAARTATLAVVLLTTIACPMMCGRMYRPEFRVALEPGPVSAPERVEWEWAIDEPHAVVTVRNDAAEIVVVRFDRMTATDADGRTHEVRWYRPMRPLRLEPGASGSRRLRITEIQPRGASGTGACEEPGSTEVFAKSVVGSRFTVTIPVLVGETRRTHTTRFRILDFKIDRFLGG